MLNERWSMLRGNGTARGGWQDVQGAVGQRGARVDVEVVVACVPQGAGGWDMGTALTHSEEVILQEHWYPQG